LLHGLGSKFSVNMGYLDILRPYAERGLRELGQSIVKRREPPLVAETVDNVLEEKLVAELAKLENENEIAGAQVCVLNKDGETLVDITAGNLGGLKSNTRIQRTDLVLGFSCTKAVAATLAHIMVADGYLSYDEPVVERVWLGFCPTVQAPKCLHEALNLNADDVDRRWSWKRQITLRHILKHQAGFMSSIPSKLSVPTFASCEYCIKAFEFNAQAPEDTLLPDKEPGEATEYHFLSFGWLVAGTLCGAYALKHDLETVTFDQVYQSVLAPKLSSETETLGFRPTGSGADNHTHAMTTTGDIRASKLMQRERESFAMGDESEDDGESSVKMANILQNFRGKEFLLDPRIWNCSDAIHANVPAAGGRFSAAALASFYHDLFCKGVLKPSVLQKILSVRSTDSVASALQGVTQLTNDRERTSLGFGYQWIHTEKDDESSPSGLGHAGIGGSIGFHHRPSGLSIGLMLNKADGGSEVTKRILRVLSKHFDI
jgi:CubicO group peptidase (beta-lactamase class C family)